MSDLEAYVAALDARSKAERRRANERHIALVLAVWFGPGILGAFIAASWQLLDLWIGLFR